MIVDKRGIAFFIALATTRTASIHNYGCEAFTSTQSLRSSIPHQNHDCHRGILPSSSLRAFPSDYDSPEQVTQLQNDHFVVSKTTSTFSEPATVGTTPIAPPLMARPSTETKTNEHAMTRVGAAAPPQTTLPSIWEREKPIIIQGGSQRTWSFQSSRHNNMIQVHTRTEGNPMYANINLWQGPGNIPQKIKLYSEDGLARPFRCFLPVIGNGGGYSNSINIRNTASLEFPLEAILEAPTSETKNGLDIETNQRMNLLASSQQKERHVQGGSTITERFEPNVKSLQIYVSSEGRPVNCRIELVSGPNNIKQVMEVYCDEGQVRPFYTVLETPGYLGGSIRVINTGTIEFPFSTIVAPWEVVSKKEMYKNMNLGGTSNPIEMNGAGSSFGNVVAQMGGFGNSISMGTGGYGAAAPTQKKRVFAPAAKEKAAAAPPPTSKKTSEPKKLPLPPLEQSSSISNKTSEQKKIPMPDIKQPTAKKKNSRSKKKNVNGDHNDLGSTEKILMDIWDKKLESEGDKKARQKEKQKSEAAADAKTILFDTDQNSSGKSKKKQNLEFIDADIDMECVIKEGDIDASVECSAVENDIEAKIETEVEPKLTVEDDIEAKIEAEVERKLKESKIQEEKERVAAEAKAAAAAAASLEEIIRKEKEAKEKIQKEKELKERIEAEAKEKIQKEKELKERIEAEAKARFDARILREQKEIESQRKEIERMNAEMKEKEERLRIEKQEEIARKKQMEENNKPKVAPTAKLQQQQQQQRVHQTQQKKPARLVLDIDDAFK